MQRWSDKKTTETRSRTYVLPPAMRTAGTTITGINAVSAAVYDLGEITDPNPAAILSGSPTIVSAAFLVGQQSIGANQAVIQTITGGVVGCLYVLTFDLALSTGERFIEDTTQMIVEYVPA